MERQRRILACALLSLLPLTAIHAAVRVEYNFDPITKFNSFQASLENSSFTEIERHSDKNNLTHIRMQQNYQGYPVFGAEYLLHVSTAVAANTDAIALAKKAPQAFINGNIYKNLTADLKSPAAIFTAERAERAKVVAIEQYMQKIGAELATTDQTATPMVYVNDNQIARWVYQISFNVANNVQTNMPARPVYLLDAENFTVYAQWDEIKTESNGPVMAGGFGGNKKMGQLVYDALQGNLGELPVNRSSANQTCYWENDAVEVLSFKDHKLMHFPCALKDKLHGGVYWVGALDAVNDGYSPSNDALFGGLVIKNMYQDWYQLPVLKKNGKPMKLTMVVHDPIDNAFWDGKRMTFGDGVRYFYPLTSLGVAAHEISHGFTEQHSNLYYYGESGGMNEAFSDMAAQAAELYAYGKNSFQIGPEIFKAANQALRYMDIPSRDCGADREPGNWCSIDHADEYFRGLDVHFSSGIYNRVFYLLATSPEWNTRKAFDVMTKANTDYWTKNATFASGACGVMQAAKDLSYDPRAVKVAFISVGVKTDKCPQA